MISPIAKIVGKPITGKILGVVVAVVVVLVILLGLSYCSGQKAQRELGGLEQAAAQCQADNENQTEQVNQCVDGFTALADRLRIEQQRLTEAEQAARLRDAERLRTLDQERAARQAIISEIESCAAWSADDPCAEIWAEMRDRRARLIQRWQDENG